MRQTVPAVLPLFRSESQVRMLARLLLEPDRGWAAEELAGAIGSPRTSVFRELQRAVAAGVVERSIGVRPYGYRAAVDSPLYKPLREILEMTVGVEAEVKRLLVEAPNVESAVIHGSWADGSARMSSDLDLLVVGDVDIEQLRRDFRILGRRLGRRIDVTAFRAQELSRRIEAGDGFVSKLLGGAHRVLFGEFPPAPS
jgi:predicted nucleotidyltransferase